MFRPQITMLLVKRGRIASFAPQIAERIPSMWLASLLQHPASTQQLVAWATDLARRCHDGVALRLDQAMYRMSLPEARGYIRARSAQVIEQEIATLQQRTGLQPAVVPIVRKRATEEVVRMAMGDLLKATRQSPAHRRAA
jgi:hypothetical protein